MASTPLYKDSVYVDIKPDKARKYPGERAGYYNGNKMKNIANIADQVGYPPERAVAVSLREGGAGEITPQNPYGYPFVVNKHSFIKIKGPKGKEKNDYSDIEKLDAASYKAATPARENRYKLENKMFEASNAAGWKGLDALNNEMLTPEQQTKIKDNYTRRSHKELKGILQEISDRERADESTGMGIEALKIKADYARSLGKRGAEAELTANQGFGKVKYNKGTAKEEIVDNEKTNAYGKDVLAIENEVKPLLRKK